MALAAKKVSQSVAVIILLLLFSAVHAHARYIGIDGVIPRPTPRDDNETRIDAYFFGPTPRRGGRKYQAYRVLLRKHPPTGGEAMDDKDARRRWYESFVPSTPTDSGEPRLLDCYSFEVNGFLATLTMPEAWALAKKPGVVRRMSSLEYLGPYIYDPASCGFVTAITKRSSVRSRPAL